jgi:hypothetical protein
MPLWLTSLMPNALVPLVIPAAILVGLLLRRPQGIVIATAGAAILALAAFWIPAGGISGLRYASSGQYPFNIYVLACALLLFMASWALSLAASAQSRRWAWVALLVAAGYLSALAIIVSVASPDPCLFPPSFSNASLPINVSYCQGANPLGGILVAAGYFLAPVAALASALPLAIAQGSIGRRLGPPDGLRVSPLATTPDGDTDPEMRVERL